MANGIRDFPPLLDRPVDPLARSAGLPSLPKPPSYFNATGLSGKPIHVPNLAPAPRGEPTSMGDVADKVARWLIVGLIGLGVGLVAFFGIKPGVSPDQQAQKLVDALGTSALAPVSICDSACQAGLGRTVAAWEAETGCELISGDATSGATREDAQAKIQAKIDAAAAQAGGEGIGKAIVVAPNQWIIEDSELFGGEFLGGGLVVRCVSTQPQPGFGLPGQR